MFSARNSDFQGAGKAPGLEVWRIEKLKPVPLKPADFGTFFSGDSYIVLKTVQKPQSSSLVYDIFFWLGEDSSQDEEGTAALKTVELDDFLGGGPVQHREVQGSESQEFFQCFSKVQYKKGGVASGFKHVDRSVYETQLLQVKGTRNVRVSPVHLSAKSLNAGDCFVLNSANAIMQWNGSSCNKKERSKALEVSISIKDELTKGKAKLTAVEQGAEPEEFWKLLGGKGPIAAAVNDSSEPKDAPRLFKVSDKSGTTEVPSKEDGFNKEQLVSEDVFILDTYSCIFVWVGKGASAAEKKGGMSTGTQYVKQGSRPNGTSVKVVKEDAEPPLFKVNFAKWHEPNTVAPMGFAPPGRKIASRQPSLSSSELADAMIHAPEPSQATMVDDGSGKVEVFDIVNFEPAAQDVTMKGQLFAGDSYIIVYSYIRGNKECGIVYFWQGTQSSKDECMAAALHSVKIDEQRFKGEATQVRVQMGKEPAHLINIFKGLMVIHSGGHASAFHNAKDRDSYDTDGIALYQIKGSHDTDAHAVQVEEKACRLNSGDCFILLTPKSKFVWKGQKSSDVELSTAKHLASILQEISNLALEKRAVTTVMEGSEPDEFWSALGGKAEYPNTKEMPEGERDPQLFQISNETGFVSVTPIYGFAQTDLEEDDIFILDVYTSIFVWVGSEANEQEKKRAPEIAAEYLKASGGVHQQDTPIITVHSGNEPMLFTCHFLGWDSTKKTRFVDPYEAKLAEQTAKNNKENDEPAQPNAEVPKISFKSPAELRVPFLQLAQGSVPAGVDPSIKEQYLSDAEFEQILGSPRSEFDKLKQWKKNQLKKAAGLF